MTKEIATEAGTRMRIEHVERKNRSWVNLSLSSPEPCHLHWALSASPDGEWCAPPKSMWPKGTLPQGKAAVQTPFQENGDRSVQLPVSSSPSLSYLVFVLYFPESKKWDNNRGRNYAHPLIAGAPFDVASLLDESIGDREKLFREIFELEGGFRLGAAVIKNGEDREVILLTDLATPVNLHWGIAERTPRDWRFPPPEIRPAGTTSFDEKAANTPFVRAGAVNRLNLVFPKDSTPAGLPFVLREIDPERWRKNRGRNFFIPLAEPRTSGAGSSALAREIIEAETGPNSWSLMHRHNLCHDLLDRTGGNPHELALLYVWLRFSALRQLDWQRNYNTKPRELAHAQDRLTRRMAGIYIEYPDTQEWIRLMLGSVGRGGEGQQIRDEILAIMHRHHIKEASGHFMEEWHQKLHNNTTPDDVVICRAFIEFLKSDGNLDVFHRTLEADGVTRERLASFERPIVSQPDFVPHLKDALIADFSRFLKMLRSVHSGTDLDLAIENAVPLIGDDTRGRLHRLRDALRNPDAPLLERASALTDVRGAVTGQLRHESDAGRARELLYLDIALEEALRMAVERDAHDSTDERTGITLLERVLRNVAWSHNDDELPLCESDWAHWEESRESESVLALKRMALFDRLRRAVTNIMDRLYQKVQPLAGELGEAFGAAPWTVNLFGEAVVRGRPIFALSSLIRHLDPILREKAGIGGWQIVSRGEAYGKLEVVQSLQSLQGKVFKEKTIVVADTVSGEEEPPPGVTGIITSRPIDLVSHVAVRARNAPVLFAICYEAAILERLKSLAGKQVYLEARPSGTVEFRESQKGERTGPSNAGGESTPLSIAKPELTREPITREEFREGLVGGKAQQLRALRDRLPDWVHVPASAALPFGVFEATLEAPANKDVLAEYKKLRARADKDAEQALPALRKALLKLEPAEGLAGKLSATLTRAGISAPPESDWEKVWHGIKQVWASKWNDRAFFSRRARSISHEEIHMAVLIQELVPVDYAFVLHTADPFTGSDRDLYGELVNGLGETLVSNYPGTALSFRSPKKQPKPKVLAYSSKSLALAGKGWIFRSDSNAEDLSGYAGAGLYESIVVPPPETVRLRYAQDRLMTDAAFCESLLKRITELGSAVESAFDGVPQDIEGGYVNERFHVVQSRPQVGTTPAP